MANAPVTVDSDELRRPFSRRCRIRPRRGRGAAQSFHAGLDSPQYVGIVAFAALQPTDEKLPLLELTASALQRRPQFIAFLREFSDGQGLEGQLIAQAPGIALDGLNGPACF